MGWFIFGTVVGVWSHHVYHHLTEPSYKFYDWSI